MKTIPATLILTALPAGAEPTEFKNENGNNRTASRANSSVA
jgi:hypothetical protein